jgi:hypothetical protein
MQIAATHTYRAYSQQNIALANFWNRHIAQFH